MKFMLWLVENRQASQAEKISLAADYYLKKYGKPASVAYFNPAELKPEESIDGVQVKARREVLPGHLWIGQETGVSDVASGAG